MRKIKSLDELNEAEDFFSTEAGRMLYTFIHDHNSGLGYIKSATDYISKNRDNLSKEDLDKWFSIIEKGADKCRDAADFLYEQIKKKEQSK